MPTNATPTSAAQARDVATAREACAKHRPDVLILDLALPDGDGLDVARTFIDVSSHGRVLVVTGQASEFICPAWLNDHLQAVISKNDAFDAVRRELDELIGPTVARVGSRGLDTATARESGALSWRC